jgi:hypothetical protein
MFFPRLICASAVILIFAGLAVCQRTTDTSSQSQRSSEPLEKISNDLNKISRSVEGLTKNWKEFFAAFSTNQGLQLTERQQKILLALEILNRGEVRLGNLQKMRMDATEKLSTFRLQLARIENDLLPESIDRYVALRGTTDAEQLRDRRRQSLYRERLESSNLINQVQRELDITNDEIRQTEMLLRNIRARLFPEIDRELADL